MIGDPEIRIASSADAEGICRLHRASIRQLCSGHYQPREIEAWAGQRQPTEYAEAMRKLTVLVAEAGGTLAGFSVLDTDAGTLHALYVHPGCVGRGVGSRLLDAAEERFRAARSDRVTLNATLNSVGFYESKGFVVVAPGTNVLPSGVALSCVEMEKPLADAGREEES